MEKHVLDDLSAYLDQELSPDEDERVALHLEECISCKEVYMELTDVSFALKKHWSSLEPSLDVTERIGLSIQREEIHRERKAKWGTIGILVASLLLVGGFLFSPWGLVLSRIVYVTFLWLLKGLTVLEAVVSVSHFVVGLSFAGIAVLMIGSVWSVRKLVSGFSTGEMV